MWQTIRAVLFDKDGTLFGFEASWGAWAADAIADLAEGKADRATGLAAAMRFDPVARRFAPDSPVIAATTTEVAERLLPLLPHHDARSLLGRLNRLAAAARMVEAVPLAPLMAELRRRGLRLGVATNDAADSASAHLRAAGLAGAFDFVAGYDSGFGAKPAPGMLLAFAEHTGLSPESVAMVGDSTHDLAAGRAAGMRTIGVLTGPARAEDLAPLADLILPDIGHLPDLLDGGGLSPA
jgi:phosphoglycolate phosphatase